MCVPSKTLRLTSRAANLNIWFFTEKDTGAALTFFACEKNENISKRVFQNENPHSSIPKKPFKQARNAFYFVGTLL